MLAKYEPYRRQCLIKFIVSGIIAFLLMLPSYYSFVAFTNLNQASIISFFFSVVVFIIGELFLLYSINLYMQFSNNIKKMVMTNVWELFSDLKYIQGYDVSLRRNPESINKSIIRIEDMQNCALFGDFNYKIVDDAFMCSYKNLNSKMEEMSLYFGSTNIFKGVIFQFPLKKTLEAQTVVIKDFEKALSKISNKLFPWAFLFVMPICCIALVYPQVLLFSVILAIFFVIFSLEPIKRPNIDCEDVNLEDVVFKKRFKVYSNSQIEARVLLSPAFMDRLKNMQTAFGNSNIRCSFFDSSLIIAIETNKRLFEVGNLFVPLT